jgi:large subunit ribosomal protein L9
MKVFLLKDVVHVGLAGEIKNVEAGYGRNYLLPRGFAYEVTPSNEQTFKARQVKVEYKKEALATQTSMLAEKIKTTKIAIKKKIHDDGKLYGAINASDIVEKLAECGINISKSQVEFNKTIKTKGNFEVVIKLTSRLKPTLQVAVLPE